MPYIGKSLWELSYFDTSKTNVACVNCRGSAVQKERKLFSAMLKITV